MRSYISAILGSLLLFAPTAFAASTGDVRFQGSGRMALTGLTDTGVAGGNPIIIHDSGEIVTSIKVSGDSLELPIASGATVGFTSTSKMGVSVSPTAFITLAKSCSDSGTTFSGRNTTGDTVTATFTLTRESSGACPGGSSGGAPTSGGGGGGGGGGGAGAAPAAPAAPSAPAVPPPPALITKLISAEFLKNLSLGAKGEEDVRRLRQVLGLADDSDVFDAVLRDKLVAFQLKYKIILTANEEGAGNLGPKTRAAIAKLFPNKQAVVLVPNPEAKGAPIRAAIQALLHELSKQVAALAAKKGLPASFPVPPAPAVAQPSAVAKVVSPVFNTNLGVGARGADVNRLQESLGMAPTGYYGPLTRQAVLKFQLEKGVVKSATDLGAGRLGPATRAKLKEVFGEPKPAVAALAPVPAPAQSTISPEKKQEIQTQVNALRLKADALRAAFERAKQLEQLKAAQEALKALQQKAAQKKP